MAQNLFSTTRMISDLTKKDRHGLRTVFLRCAGLGKPGPHQDDGAANASANEFGKKYGRGLWAWIWRRIGLGKPESYREYGPGFFGAKPPQSHRPEAAQLFFHKLKAYGHRLLQWYAAFFRKLLCIAAVCGFPSWGWAAECLDPPGDVNATGVTNVADVQCMILAVLADLSDPNSPPPLCALVSKTLLDVDCDAQRNVNDILIVINYGLQSPLNLTIDTNQNQCPDACETQCSGKMDGTPCDADSSGCTADDACSAGVCVAGKPVGCADSVPCTQNSCVSTGTNTYVCQNPILSGKCLIDGICYDSNTTNPENLCLLCKPTTTQTAWSTVATGTACDADGNGCTTGDSCAAGVCIVGPAADCNDGLTCTSDLCVSESPSSFTCDHPVLNKTCFIDGVCWAANDPNPSNDCQVCKSSVAKTAWTAKEDTTSCDADGSGCTHNDTCQGGQCIAGAAPNCADGLSCTTDACVSTTANTYQCTHAANPTQCLIDGVCWAGGAGNPDNPCLQCNAATSISAWTAKTNGTACDADTNGCTVGDQCQTGVCTPGAAPNCNDNKACTADSCTSTGATTFVCNNIILPDRCLIGTTCRTDGVANPSNPCQECAPLLSQTQWSPKPNGTACELTQGFCTVDTCVAGSCTATAQTNCNDSKSCTTDVCDGGTSQCIHTVGSGSCLIDGICYGSNEPNPQNPCQVCKPGQNKTTWSSQTNGTPCNADNNGCTTSDQCSSGVCLPGTTETCDDGLSCTTGSCVSSSATTFGCDQKPTSGTCAIAGTCYDSGEINPENPCEKCAPAQSKTAWSPRSDGVACDADNSGCTVGDTCQSGVCSPGPTLDCDDGADCTIDICSSADSEEATCSHTVTSGFCLIDGVCVTGQSDNPEDPCQRCKPALTKTAWSAGPDGTPCDADQSGCTVQDTCILGVCTPGETNECEDGLTCTADFCSATGSETFVCGNSLTGGFCLIDGQCYEKGEQHPNNPCQSCRPALSTSAWSNKNDGVVCEKDNNLCTDDVCAAGVCTTETTETCDDEISCTNDVCDPATGECSHSVIKGSCWIDGNCWEAHAQNPANPCLKCKPAQSKTAWSALEDGTGCDADSNGCTQNDSCQQGVCIPGVAPNCGDGLGCTTDSCVSAGPTSFTCTHPIESTKCLIDGVCFSSGGDNPENACQQCKPSTSSTEWTAKNNGVACEIDNNGCTQGDSCQGGTCVAGTLVNCNDNKGCTTDGCVSLSATTYQCTNLIKSGKCLINGVCMDDGDPNPTNSCQECAPALSTTAYSPRPNGTACDIAGPACTIDTCQGGVCVLSGNVNCNDNLACTTDSCSATTNSCVNSVVNNFCLIEGVCWAGQAVNPQNPCQSCKPATSKTTWSNTTNGTPCNADNNGCTVGDVCSGGFCEAGPTANCSDGLACTTETCVSTGASTFTCSVAVLKGNCAIAGVCYTADEKNPAQVCEKCTPSKSQSSFSPRADGQVCNADNSACTGGDSCLVGVCVPGPAVDCSDGLPCTDDGCTSSGSAYSCTHTIKSQRCVIGGECFKEGEENPQNDCQHCKSATNTTSFTNKNTNAACEADLDPCTDMDYCTNGQCVASSPSTCDDGTECTQDSCIPFVGCQHTPVAIFVDGNNTNGAADGSSWEKAFPTIRSALAVAEAGSQLFVAQGTYYHDPQIGDAASGQMAVVPMKDDVDLYGGFAGNECSIAQRPYPLAPTILSADFDKDGVTDYAATAPFIGDNPVLVRGASQSTLDGFILGGAGGVDGATPYQGRAAIEVINESHFVVRNCKIVGNAMTVGKNLTASTAAIVAIELSSDVLIDRCEFTANTSSSSDPVLRANYSSNVEIRDSLFLENESLGFEMAAEFVDIDGLILRGTRFWGNQGLISGQRRVVSVASCTGVTADNLTFFGNSYLGTASGFALWVNNTPGVVIRGVSAAMEPGAWSLLRNEWGSSVTVANAAVFGSDALPVSYFNAAPPLFHHTCYGGAPLEGTANGVGNIHLTDTQNPFVVADLHLYLVHAGLDGQSTTSPCVDAGDPVSALESGVPYWALSTRTDGAADLAPVDIGAHNLPCDIADSASCAAVQPCSQDSDCNDGLACTSDSCVFLGASTLGCVHTIKPAFCLIGGQCIAENTTQTGSSCESCQPTLTNTAWSWVADGSFCGSSTNACAPKSCQSGVCVQKNPCEDGLSCTTNTCTTNGSGGYSCSQTVINGACYVNGVCYVTNDADPSNPCKECKPATSKVAFSNRNNGVACENDADPCTIGSVCSAGVCGAPTGTLDCGDQNGCTTDFCTPLVGCGHSPAALFVDDDSTAVNPDGSSWDQAYPTITDALAKTAVNKVIYVAEGLYTATLAFGNVVKVPPLVAKSGVTVVGGFVPGQCSPDERTFPLPPSVLTSDIDGDGIYTNGVDAPQAIQIWNVFNVVIDGFVMGPGAVETDAGYHPLMFVNLVHADQVTLRNLSMAGVYNTATGGNVGSAMRIEQGDSIVIERCSFDNNIVTSISGGGLGIDHSNNVTVRQCSFTNNDASHGAGLSVITTPDFLLEDSTFVGNEGSGSYFYDGGAVFLSASDGAVIRNCTFIDNQSSGGGGSIFAAGTDITISGCSFYGNAAPSTNIGQDIWGHGSMVAQVHNCVFYPESPTKSVFGMVNGASIIPQHCCAPALGGTPGSTYNVTFPATTNPFVQKGARLYLQHAGLDGATTSSVCVNAGSDSLANTAGIDWATLTTRTDNGLDSTPVDIGAHYVAPCQGIADGSACDDSDPCTLGETCISGVCTAALAQNCSDGLGCTVDVCVAENNTSFTCTHTLKSNRCFIGGQCVVDGTANGDNSCLVCDADQTQTAWSNQLDGTLCALDGNGCTADSCAGGLCTPGTNSACDDGLGCTTEGCSSLSPDQFQCTTTITNGFCALNGACYTQNELNPDNGCQHCKPAIIKSEWTERIDGAECEGDGGLCVAGETCLAGVCGGGEPVDCDDGDGCTLDSCAPSSGCLHRGVAVFVDGNAPGPIHDGASWATAFTTIQDAVDAADEGDEIWVAEGLYWSAVGDSALVELKPGVDLYGGFEGTECDRSERPEPPLLTRLVGDSDQDAISETTDALYLMVGASDTVVDGVYFGGTAGSNGLKSYLGRYGLAMDSVENVTVRNCTFDSHGYFVGVGGGAIVENSDDVLFVDCVFKNNDASNGAGAYVADSTLVEFRGVVFENNLAFNGGGALDLNRAPGTQIRDCVFVGNSAAEYSQGKAGALIVSSSIDINVLNTAFYNNTASVNGGAISGSALMSAFPTSILVSGCSFYENEAGVGGAIYAGALATIEIVNTAGFANKGLAGASGDEFVADSGSAQPGSISVSYTCSPVSYSGTGNILLDSTTENPFVVDNNNLFLKFGGGNSSPCINAGSSAAAKEADILWKQMTTRNDGVTDNPPIDMGAHYATCNGKQDGTACSDSDPCTLSDMCINEVCKGTPKVCDDGDGFTIDVCGANGVCVFTPDCDDGDPCTTDVGEAGVCYHNPVAIFVDHAAPGPVHDGTSWGTAFLTIADAMAIAAEGQQVFVADGVYKGKQAKSNVLSMKLGVDVYGGFGAGECSVESRKQPLVKTELNGDWDNSGGWSANDSEHVVVAAHDTILDGFTIAGGANFGDSSDLAGGAGLRIVGRQNFVGRNLKITNNYSAEGPVGGVMVKESNNIVIEDSSVSYNETSTVVQNPGGTGGMLVTENDGVKLRGVSFEYNEGWEGGALRALDTVFTDIVDCTFRGNIGNTQSGGVSLGYAAAYTTITNSSFYANEADTTGGAIGAIYAWIYVKISGCSFYQNQGTTGGAIYSAASNVSVVNSAFFDNEATTGVGHETAVSTAYGSAVSVTYSCLPVATQGTGNLVLNPTTGNPFTVSGSKLFLKHAGISGATTTSACVDAGNNSAADAAKIAWKQKTTRKDGILDTTPVDMGVHWEP
ncbi:MAG: right-handed parallel beta-helix repeat-containing protein [Myxococcales bacterium]|nr:right-handed parallel beta-helix repeat-containing protein [Myxococcales bacterium]